MSRTMAYHTFSSLLYHCVFSTKNRLPSIPVQLLPRLWSYMGGIARANDFKALAVGGRNDHAHLLLSLPIAMPIPKAMQLIKAGSSKWLHEHGADRFDWQVGYGVFTIGISQIPATVAYIHNQQRHHAKRNFAQEWATFIKRHGLEEG